MQKQNPVLVTIRQAKAQLEALLKRAGAGEEIIIARNDVPIAQLVPIRPLGVYRRQIEIADDFDVLLPDEILGGFSRRECAPSEKAPSARTKGIKGLGN